MVRARYILPSVLALAAVLAGCHSGSDQTSVPLGTLSSADTAQTSAQIAIPNDVTAIMNTSMGEALKSYGYTPVDVLHSDGKDITVYVRCGKDLSLTNCAAKRHDEATAFHPNVFVVNNNVVALGGPHSPKHKEHNYYVDIPPGSWQHFADLSTKQRLQLLNMTSIITAIGNPPLGRLVTLLLPDGQTQANVS